MTIRQKILKLVYPFLMKWGSFKGEKRILVKENNAGVSNTFYALSVQLNNNNDLPFSALRGKKVLLVNTASNCGYTGQYAELQKLYEQYQDQLVIIGFPANDFKEQEKGSDEEIAQFCQVNFGVSFPLTKKTTVVKAAAQHPVFRWLSHKEQNGWNDQGPTWNFSKYLVNEQGVLTHFFDPSLSPLSKDVTSAIGNNYHSQ